MVGNQVVRIDTVHVTHTTNLAYVELGKCYPPTTFMLDSNKEFPPDCALRLESENDAARLAYLDFAASGGANAADVA